MVPLVTSWHLAITGLESATGSVEVSGLGSLGMAHSPSARTRSRSRTVPWTKPGNGTKPETETRPGSWTRTTPLAFGSSFDIYCYSSAIKLSILPLSWQ